MGTLLNSTMLNIRLFSLCLGVVVVGQHLNGVHLSPKFDWAKRFGNNFNNGYPMMRRSLMSPDDHHPPLKRLVEMDPGFPMMKKWSDLGEQIETLGLAPPEFDYFF